MQVVIFCGGKGTRLSEYTNEIPKPLIKIGPKPILHHLMEYYASYGYKDFILCLGYKGDKIKEYFNGFDEWEIEFADTGEDSNKAERLVLVKDLIKGDDFFLTYGDDLGNVDIKKLTEFHKKNRKIVTLTAVPLQSPFGIVDLNEKGDIIGFREKPKLDCLMSGGFYVVNKKIFIYLKQGYDLEKEAFDELARNGHIAAFRHDGFWKSMNTLKDVIELNEMYSKGELNWIRK